MVTTNPILIFAPTSWDSEYNGAAEPPAATPAWTLTGTDHATSDGSELTIETCGTDECSYYLALGSHTVDSVVWAEATFHIDSGYTGAFLCLKSDDIGKKVTLSTQGDSTLRFAGSSNDDVSQALTSEITVRVMLAKGGYRAWLVNSDTTLTELSSGAAATESSDAQCEFGKLHTADEDTAIYFNEVDFGAGDSFIFSIPADLWDFDEYKPENRRNVAYSGTVETIHARSDRFGNVQIRNVTDAYKSTVSGYFDSYIDDGSTWYIAEDEADHTTSWYAVILEDKKWRWRRDPHCAVRWSKKIRLRVVSE